MHPLQDKLRLQTINLPETDDCEYIDEDVYLLKLQNPEFTLFDTVIIKHRPEYFTNRLFFICTNNNLAVENLESFLSFILPVMGYRLEDETELDRLKDLLKRGKEYWKGEFSLNTEDKTTYRTRISIETSDSIKDLIYIDEDEADTIDDIFENSHFVLELGPIKTMHGSAGITFNF
ncbi:hypothetical protein [Pontibacter indicus]|uniref:Uncharacterized protein n=1 Tax=Pontibacter indicus TaxID=1317125 RepID=A0A1R3XS11_9BACT|nr:hypothetical protein [Pontibacter indicus]SIT94658.1 hypothetical protein SAMN05444128_3698 [Pontibacter indicus]